MNRGARAPRAPWSPDDSHERIRLAHELKALRDHLLILAEQRVRRLKQADMPLDELVVEARCFTASEMVYGRFDRVEHLNSLLMDAVQADADVKCDSTQS